MWEWNGHYSIGHSSKPKFIDNAKTLKRVNGFEFFFLIIQSQLLLPLYNGCHVNRLLVRIKTNKCSWFTLYQRFFHHLKSVPYCITYTMWYPLGKILNGGQLNKQGSILVSCIIEVPIKEIINLTSWDLEQGKTFSNWNEFWSAMIEMSMAEVFFLSYYSHDTVPEMIVTMKSLGLATSHFLVYISLILHSKASQSKKSLCSGLLLKFESPVTWILTLVTDRLQFEWILSTIGNFTRSMI